MIYEIVGSAKKVQLDSLKQGDLFCVDHDGSYGLRLKVETLHNEHWMVSMDGRRTWLNGECYVTPMEQVEPLKVRPKQ